MSMLASRSVLHLSEVNEDYVTFGKGVGGGVVADPVRIPYVDWTHMERPEKITVSVEPGDRLDDLAATWALK